MKVLHTADWHAGRTLAGQDRTPEISASLDALLALVEEHAVDLVLVAGDQHDTTSPSAAAEAAVNRFYARLSKLGVPAVEISGNHDSPARVDARADLLDLANVTSVGMPRTRAQGGTFPLHVAGEDVTIVAAPFVSYRRLVRTAELIDLNDEQQRGTYQDRMRAFLGNLTAELDPDALNLMLFHGTMSGATLSSEFQFHSTDTYALEAAAIPDAIKYGAFGHIHAPQAVHGLHPRRARYCGSLIQLDFGEAGQERGALLLDVTAAGVHDLEFLPLTAARHLTVVDTSYGELDWAIKRLPAEGEAWVKLRVHMDEPRPGLKERLHREAPNLLIAEFVLPEHEAGEPERIDIGEVDFAAAYRDWALHERGQEPSRELMDAFNAVDDATNPEAKEAVA